MKIQKIMAQFWNHEVTKAEIIQKYDDTFSPDDILQILENAFGSKNPATLEDALFIGFLFDLFDESQADIIARLLKKHWHRQHEDLARIVQLKLSGRPDLIPDLISAISSPPPYLEESDQTQEFIRKMIYAIKGMEGGLIKIEELKKNGTNQVKETINTYEL